MRNYTREYILRVLKNFDSAVMHQTCRWVYNSRYNRALNEFGNPDRFYSLSLTHRDWSNGHQLSVPQIDIAIGSDDRSVNITLHSVNDREVQRFCVPMYEGIHNDIDVLLWRWVNLAMIAGNVPMYKYQSKTIRRREAYYELYQPIFKMMSHFQHYL